MGCIFVIICVITDSGLGYLMVASPFGPFKVKVNGFLRKAFCLEPEFHFDIADVSSPYFLGPKRKTFAYHKSVIKPRPMGSY